MESNVFERYGFKYEDHLNILVDLTKSEAQLWNEVNSKRRNEIRRALKENAYFSVEESVDSLLKSYAILKEVYDRAKLPLPDYKFFENLKSSLNGESKLHIFTAKYNGKIIGCMLALGYKNTIYDFYAGAYSEYYKKYPNDLIPWEVFRWAKQHGYTVFDFGGAGKPDVPYGVRDYKKKFGGTMVELGRYEKVHQPVLMKTAKLGLKVWQKMK
jgi:lipid II:glycine glycyltransferase (peptidoglycan interpeptide bridge formation enzyme)